MKQIQNIAVLLTVCASLFAQEAAGPLHDGSAADGTVMRNEHNAANDGEMPDYAYDDEEFYDFGTDEGLTVIGTKETTQQMKVIGQEEIEKRAAPDLASLLEEALDMGITRYGAYGSQTEMNMRGFDTERIAILINGVPANSPRSGEFDINQIDLASVERIEVIYGGSDSKFNVTGALGGVINIITLKKQPKGLHYGGGISNISYAPGKYNEHEGGGSSLDGSGVAEPHYEDLADTQQVSTYIGYGGDTFSLKANWFGNRAGNHYLYRDSHGFARRKQSNAVWDTGLGLSLVWDLPYDAAFLSTTDVYYADKEYPVTGMSAAMAKSYDTSLKETLMLDMPRAFRDDLSMEASLSYTFANMRYGAISRSDDHYITAINRWGWYPTETLTFRSGVDWRSIRVDSTDDGLRTGHNGGVYGTVEFKPVRDFLLIASIKGASDMKQGAVVPKAGFVWHITDNITLKNNYFRSFKFPDFDDLYYRSLDQLFIGNPNLKPEDGLGADLGGTLTAGNPARTHFSLDTTIYAQWTEDSIHWIKRGGRWSPDNVGTAFFIGSDLRPTLTLTLPKGPFEKLRLGLSWQYQLSWLLNEGLAFADALRIPYMPTHILGGSADLSWQTGSLLVSAHWESTRYADTRNEMALPSYCLLNITVNQNIGRHWTAFAAVHNALNALYTSFAEYPMPGLNMTLGLRAKFDVPPSP
jgi:vitamin B12 transporter